MLQVMILDQNIYFFVSLAVRKFVSDYLWSVRQIGPYKPTVRDYLLAPQRNICHVNKKLWTSTLEC